MKYIYANLKRFDIPKEYGGVNSVANPTEWGEYIVENVQEGLKKYKNDNVEFVMYLPEAHLINSITSLSSDDNLQIGSQGVFQADTSIGGNFGAFTTNKTANSMKAIGCTSTIIGHCEERNAKASILKEANVIDSDAINRILNMEVKAATDAGLSVLYCIGEKSSELDNWQEVLKKQIDIGLKGIDRSKVTIAYEPVWAIGPGKTPPTKEYITEIAKFVKEISEGLPVVYGGGLKEDNAEMLANIPEIDGGLIALTRFQGDIGFYPDEYLRIIEKFLDN